MSENELIAIITARMDEIRKTPHFQEHIIRKGYTAKDIEEVKRILFYTAVATLCFGQKAQA